MSYDSTEDTKAHISEVRILLAGVVTDIQERMRDHDKSKLEAPEKEIFDAVTPKLRTLTYGSPEYHASLEEMGPALDHHYSVNAHHPEHHEDGIHGMNLVDLIEMLADWKAATLRHDDGDLKRSIDVNAERFGYGEEIHTLLLTTARDLGWLE